MSIDESGEHHKIQSVGDFNKYGFMKKNEIL